ncbi:MAG: ribonuclease P protein component [Saprospiraceae bacterium]
MPSFTFKRTERLKSRKTIQKLFSNGNSYAVYPLRLVWIPVEKVEGTSIQFALSVAKKRVPKAAHRNILRRRIRESWRLHKHLLYQQLEGQEQCFAFMVLFTGNKELPYETIEESMKTIIQRFPKKMRANQKANR